MNAFLPGAVQGVGWTELANWTSSLSPEVSLPSSICCCICICICIFPQVKYSTRLPACDPHVRIESSTLPQRCILYLYLNFYLYFVNDLFCQQVHTRCPTLFILWNLLPLRTCVRLHQKYPQVWMNFRHYCSIYLWIYYNFSMICGPFRAGFSLLLAGAALLYAQALYEILPPLKFWSTVGWIVLNRK